MVSIGQHCDALLGRSKATPLRKSCESREAISGGNGQQIRGTTEPLFTQASATACYWITFLVLEMATLLLLVEEEQRLYCHLGIAAADKAGVVG